uniref:Uncharacterized protein n=1 Tax=Branchiostoma floridae TaxID=7739 RepID=C3ZKA1_BRAFL|eukprot:XP_002590989.1 hypothetical protein BRAFLDRAFT_119094 [Branchiostoma floridae]
MSPVTAAAMLLFLLASLVATTPVQGGRVTRQVAPVPEPENSPDDFTVRGTNSSSSSSLTPPPEPACNASGYSTEFGSSFTFECRQAYALSAVRSTYCSATGDRAWNYSCTYMGLGQLDECYWSPFVNDFGADLSYQCPFNSLVTGFHRWFMYQIKAFQQQKTSAAYLSSERSMSPVTAAAMILFLLSALVATTPVQGSRVTQQVAPVPEPENSPDDFAVSRTNSSSSSSLTPPPEPACNASGYTTEFGSSFTFECRQAYALSAVRSTYCIATGDRAWNYSCTYMGLGQLDECYWSPFVNDFGSVLSYQCPFNSLVTGFYSEYDAAQSDRRWKLKCCRSDRTLLYNCQNSLPANTPAGDLEFSVFGNYFLRGVFATFRRNVRRGEKLVSPAGEQSLLRNSWAVPTDLSYTARGPGIPADMSVQGGSWLLLTGLALFFSYSAAVCPLPNYTPTSIDGYCYREKVGMFDFHAAEHICEEDGALLITDKNIYRHMWLQLKDFAQGFWLGLEDEEVPGEYYWSDNETLSEPTFWEPTIPDDPSKHCVISVRNGTGGVTAQSNWVPADCHSYYTNVVCEVDNDECASNTENACNEPNMHCVNTIGWYECECDAGYHWEGNICAGEYECECEAGYHWEGNICAGEYECECEAGYHWEGNICAGEYECECEAGYHWEGNICAGEYECECEAGYHWEGNICAEEHIGPTEAPIHDECPVGWDDTFTGMCIKAFTVKSNWPMAHFTCGTSERGRLVTIEDQEKLDFMKTYADAPNYYWIGLNDVMEEGTLVWTDGDDLDPAEFTPAVPWSSDPNYQNTDAIDCVCFAKGILNGVYNTWAFESCLTKKKFICEIDLDECSAKPCLNNGTCYEEHPVGFGCTCEPGYEGDICEIDGDDLDPAEFTPAVPWSSDPNYQNTEDIDCVCFAKGILNGVYNTWAFESCLTKKKFICEIDLDECSAKPCLNNGTCYEEHPVGFGCTCEPGYEGDICEIDIDECANVTCENGGTCVDGINEYSCDCPIGIEGTHCEINIDDCPGVTCQNGGTCVDGINDYSCDCVDGYEGEHCETDTDDCVGVNCQNGGTCVDEVDGYSCTCAPGYEGDHCETDTDDCVGVNCQNGGTCVDEVDGYSCTCAPGYEGDHCETDTDDCVGVNCQNGGTCVDEVDGYSCTCAPGYEGDHCETDTDDCVGVNCQNGGTCVDEVDGYSCTCAPGYEGDHCETDTDDCVGVDCQNGGTCVDEVDGYSCTCVPGYEGDHCETDTDDCVGVTCQNGGTCVDEVDGYSCTCAPGYEGDHCETDTDDCVGVNCQNGGTCVDEVDGYSCTCAPGYEGDHCETDTDDCVGVDCQNGGTCVDEVDGYSCTCAPGYEGDHCETDTDDCVGVDCQNGGTCVDEVDGYSCTCAPGYEGDHCETDTDDCVGVTCQNGGTCVDEVDGYSCTCAPGYEGDHCETDTDDCVGVTCQNGGTCVDEVDGYSCTCAPGYEGDHCETDTDDCVGVTCQNGGTCVDEVDGYSCTCAPGYEGDHCETDTDDCVGVTCQNGGTCVDEVDGYSCTCAPGYEGDHCETDTDDCVGVDCQNGGTCVDEVDGYSCTCAPGYEGDHCETDTDDCVGVDLSKWRDLRRRS